MFARIATETSLDRLFDYIVPTELAQAAIPGARVEAPFGRRTIEGTVIEVSDTTRIDPSKLKPITRVIGGRAFLTPPLIELAKWMGAYYLAPIERVLLTVLPAAVRKDAERTAGRARKVVEVVPQAEWKAAPDTLTPRQQEVLDEISRTEGGLLAGLCKDWHVTPGVIEKIAQAGFLRITERSDVRNPLLKRKILPSSPLPLSAEQSAALKTILGQAARPAPKPVLLFGKTASGKTEVFLQAIAAVLEQGKGAIALVPEIALTPQTIQRFASRFGKTIAVLHSQLSDGERHDEWHRIRSGEARVVVGPRSAIFAPVDNLGMIIVDEEHEPSYKQEDSPRYNARDLAVMRGSFEKCAVVLGSATPSMESWHNYLQGKYILAEMKSRIPGVNPPTTHIVNMAQDASDADGHRNYFSKELVTAIRERLDNSEQVMLFLNRRGYAPTVSCPECGHTETCDNCSMAMTYHNKDRVLRCHLCSEFKPVPQKCPKCGADIMRRGLGTQRVEDIARKLFPSARIERMDADVTSRKWSHEEILGRFRARHIDILIGTQMIAKGLDFPSVTLVGILNADASLSIPDFRAAERTFQLIAQMSGRAGRGEQAGEVYVQTMQPEHPAIACAKNEDFRAFAKHELAEREEAGFPPFSKLVCVTARGENEDAVAQYIAKVAKLLGDGGDAYINGGAAQCGLSKIRSQYRYQIILRGALKAIRAALRRAVHAAPAPDSIILTIDIDALSLF